MHPPLGQAGQCPEGAHSIELCLLQDSEDWGLSCRGLSTWEGRGVECSDGTPSTRVTHRLGPWPTFILGGQKGPLAWQPLLFPLPVGWSALEAQPLLPDQAWVVALRQLLPPSLLATAALPRGRQMHQWVTLAGCLHLSFPLQVGPRQVGRGQGGKDQLGCRRPSVGEPGLGR